MSYFDYEEMFGPYVQMPPVDGWEPPKVKEWKAALNRIKVADPIRTLLRPVFSVGGYGSQVVLRLRCRVPDRDTGQPTDLHHQQTVSGGLYDLFSPESAVEVVRKMLSDVLRHEVDESILLHTGARPFDPHAKMVNVKEAKEKEETNEQQH